MTSLFIGFVAGVLGMAYFSYGRKQAKFVPMIAGVTLCVYPWFVRGALASSLVGAALLAAPFLIDF